MQGHATEVRDLIAFADLPSGPALGGTAAIALVAGIARGFSGFGAALIFIPLVSAILGPRLAAPILLLVDAILTAPLVLPAWRLANRREVGWLAMGALIGAPIGGWLLLQLDGVTLRWAMCGLSAALLVLIASGWRYRGEPTAPLSAAVGAVSGLFSGVAQMGGPPVVAYWLGGAIPAAGVRANIVAFFAISSVISGIVYLAGGLLTREVMLLCALAAPTYGAGLWIGAVLFGLASENAFRRTCLALIALAAVLGLPLWD